MKIENICIIISLLLSAAALVCVFCFEFSTRLYLAGILLAAASLVAFVGYDISKKNTKRK